MSLQYFITRTAGETPNEYRNRVAKLLTELEENGTEWSEDPHLRGCLLLSVGHGPNRPFAYLEYPK